MDALPADLAAAVDLVARHHISASAAARTTTVGYHRLLAVLADAGISLTRGAAVGAASTTAVNYAEVLALRTRGVPAVRIATTVGVSSRTVSQWLHTALMTTTYPADILTDIGNSERVKVGRGFRLTHIDRTIIYLCRQDGWSIRRIPGTCPQRDQPGDSPKHHN